MSVPGRFGEQVALKQTWIAQKLDQVEKDICGALLHFRILPIRICHWGIWKAVLFCYHNPRSSAQALKVLGLTVENLEDSKPLKTSHIVLDLKGA